MWKSNTYAIIGNAQKSVILRSSTFLSSLKTFKNGAVTKWPTNKKIFFFFENIDL